MTKLWLDTESVGLCGNSKLIQYAVDDGPVQLIPLYRGWERNGAVVENLRKLEGILRSSETLFVGYNASFDTFALYKLYHQLSGLPLDSPDRPIRPFGCRVLDLQVPAMLNSPLAPFAFSRNRTRSIARVRRIPRVAMDAVASRVTDALRPMVPEHFNLHLGVSAVPERKDLVTLSWTVEGSVGLKPLMKEYGIPTLNLAEVWPLPDRKDEKPWLPYPDSPVYEELESKCEAVMRDPEAPFWRYSALDVLYLRVLYKKLGRPEPDHHSECTHAVAFTRYHGFGLDQTVLDASIAVYRARAVGLQRELAHIDLNSAPKRLAALQALDPLIGASNKRVLKIIADSESPAASLASKLLEYGPAHQRLIQLEKVKECRTGRAHPDLRVMGSKTGRMAGTAGLNWQGIGQAEEFRIEDVEGFEDDLEEDESKTEAEIEEELNEWEVVKKIGLRAALLTPCVGDWAQFEVCLGAAVYEDPAIEEDIERGNDAHAMIASLMHPKALEKGLTHDQIKAGYESGDPLCKKIRKESKPGTFGLQYFCQAKKLQDIFGVSLEDAQKALDRYYDRYKGFAAYRRRIDAETTTADTQRWNPDSVSRMADTVTDFTGYKMSWAFEKAVADTLWRLGCKGIRTGHFGTLVRQKEKGSQTIDQSVKSALLGGALAIQQAVARQRGNAGVQAPGANLNKMLQAECWRVLRCPMISCHDELVFGVYQFHLGTLEKIVHKFEDKWRAVAKHLRFDFKRVSRWSEK